eukprot:990592-Amphidinium_carterae.1
MEVLEQHLHQPVYQALGVEEHTLQTVGATLVCPTLGPLLHNKAQLHRALHRPTTVLHPPTTL